MACTALSIVPCAVTTITASVERKCAASCSSNSMPVMRGIFRSVTTMAGDHSVAFSSLPAVACGFDTITPLRYGFGQPAASVLFIFDD